MLSLVLKELSYLSRQKETGVTYQCDLAEGRGMTGAFCLCKGKVA